MVVFTLALSFSLLIVIGLWFVIDVLIKEYDEAQRGEGLKISINSMKFV